jgi:hypothetical protein
VSDTLPALSIRQPWAWLIANGHKDVENRRWLTRRRGPILIHAAQTIDSTAADLLALGRHPVTHSWIDFEPPNFFEHGGIVGRADIIDCVTRHPSPWFVGPFGIVLANAKPLPFMAVGGRLGFFPVDYRSVA